MINLMDALKQSLKGNAGKGRDPFSDTAGKASSREEGPSLGGPGPQGGLKVS